MKEISVGYVKHVLGNKKEILAYGRNRIKELYEEMNNTDFSVQEVAYVKILTDQSKISSSNRNADISDVLLKQKKIYQEQVQDLRFEIIRILDEEECVHRIWVCFDALDNPGKTYLKELYVEKNLYKFVEKKSGVSHRSFEQARSQAMQKLIHLYYSKLTNREIIKGANLVENGETDSK